MERLWSLLFGFKKMKKNPCTEFLNEAHYGKVDEESFKKALEDACGVIQINEFRKGLETMMFYGVEGYAVNKDTNMIRALSLEEIDSLKDDPTVEVISIREYAPKDIFDKFRNLIKKQEIDELYNNRTK